LGLELSTNEINTLINAFDRDGDKKLSLNEYLVFLRGDLNTRRKDLIALA